MKVIKQMSHRESFHGSVSHFYYEKIEVHDPAVGPYSASHPRSTAPFSELVLAITSLLQNVNFIFSFHLRLSLGQGRITMCIHTPSSLKA